MAYDGWIEYNGIELINMSRTAQLAQVLGIEVVWQTPESVAFIEDNLGGVGYNDITNAPWYDPGVPASVEFAGLVPLSVAGLDDSTLTSTVVEYITDGGHPGKPRNETLPVVFNVVLVASTDRGAEFGKRWMDRVLRTSASSAFCVGADLTYFRYEALGSDTAHRRNVRLTRGSRVTRKRITSCDASWMTTFTMTAADPFEYGEPVTVLEGLGGTPPTGPDILASGSLAVVQSECPAYNYSPVYDPLHPALVPSPTAPDFYPAGWNIVDGATFDRFWARVQAIEPSDLLMVPVVTFTSATEARMVRFSIWPSTSDLDDQCEPLFNAVLTYLPPNVEFTVDGEQQASYVWDGGSPVVRRADSLVYDMSAKPVQWVSFNDPDSYLITLDIFSDSDGMEGGGDVRVDVALVPKSD